MALLRSLSALAACLLLVACAGQGAKAPENPDVLRNAAYVHGGPPSLTLLTMVNNRSGSGGHSALMVNGAQRVIFDPAGSFRPDWVVEHGDVLYGMTDRNVFYYKSAHSRNSHHVMSQEITVSPEVAEQALRLVQARGEVSQVYCANATSDILRQLPGFQDIGVTFFPNRLAADFGARPGVVTDRLYQNDEGDVVDGIAALPVPG